MNKQNAKIDFDRSKTGRLFIQIFFPTLLGMFFGSIMNITDGIFVGRRIGSEALAAINVAAPIFMISAGLSLMFGVGASVMASVALAQNDRKSANLHVSRSLLVSLVTILVLGMVIFFFREPFIYLFGGTPLLLADAAEYLTWTAPFMVFYTLMFTGMFYIRLDGSPRYAMMCQIIPSILNIFLDWLFMFPLNMGIKGAAIASSVCGLVGAVMVAIYLSGHTLRISICRFKQIVADKKALFGNVWEQCKVGVSGLFGEFAIALMLVTGNNVFGTLLGEQGIAAYGIICYCMPLIFMIYSSVAQSMQPIISYDYGRGRMDRVHSALRLALTISLLCALATGAGMILFCHPLVYLFVGDSTPAYHIAIEGIPYYCSGFPIFAFNIIMIGYYQSINEGKRATIITLLRGYLFLLLCFTLLPLWLQQAGAWLAIPVAETLTALTVTVMLLCRKRQRQAAARRI